MKVIEPRIEVIEQEPGFLGMLKQIEIAGRTCYKSEANITNDSAEKFVERMINSGHTSMLEHGTLYFDVPLGTPVTDPYYMTKSTIIQFFKGNPYSKVNKYDTVTEDADGINVMRERYAITTNYRVFIEQIPWEKLGSMRTSQINNIILGLDKDYVLSFMCEPNEHHEKRVSIRMYTDRGVSAEANRQRADSPAEQSTRYCNYSKDKFGNEISISLNSDICEEDVNEEYNWMINNWGYGNELKSLCREVADDNTNTWNVVTTWIFVNLICEWGYMKLSKLGWKPQQCRRVLPLDLHTELVHTAFISDWKHFIALRSDGVTGAPHPDMKLIADPIKEEIGKIINKVNN